MQDIASNSTICGKDNTGGDRDTAVSTDYAACTAVASSTAATCVSGDMNEHNCGYGNSSTQVCSFCSTTPEKCCTERKCCVWSQSVVIRKDLVLTA